ncbi:MAG: hypothetical protein WCL14_13865 [Bacteroidota bacterium]
MTKPRHASGKFPSGFKGQTHLTDKIIEYKSTLPTSNWITALETTTGITLSAVHGFGVAAKVYDDSKDADHSSSMNEIELRNKLAMPLVTHMEGGFQVVKALNEPEFGVVREWGANISITGKITIPSNVIEQMDMFRLYANKYLSYSISPTPIDFYQAKHHYVMADDITDMGLVIGHDNSATDFKNLSENGTEMRNELWAPGIAFLVRLYNVGKATYTDFFRELGLMGFDMSESSPTHVEQISTALQSSQILIHGAIIGSVFENLNNFPIIIHPGEVMAKPPITLKAGELMAVKKGMSSFILENPDALNKAKIRVTVRHH